MATGQSRVDVVEGLRIATARIIASNPLRAAVIALAEPADDPKRVQGGRGLELMTGWLAEMVAKPAGTSDSGRDTEWRQISAFCRVVSEQAVLGSETAVIHVFIEALAIWDDLDVRAYAATLNRTFSQSVALSGANPELAPSIIDPRARSTIGGGAGALDAGRDGTAGFPGDRSRVRRPRAGRREPGLAAGVSRQTSRPKPRPASPRSSTCSARC